MDLNKEIHLSDLFKRKRNDGDEGGPEAEKPPKEEKPPKREKKPKAEKPPKQRKEKPPKQRKERGETPAILARSAPPLRQVPLMRPFNLLPKDVPREARESRALVPYVLVALLGVLVFAGVAALFLRGSADVTSKQNELDALRIELASLEVPEKDPLSGQRTSLVAEKTARTNALAGTLATRVPFDRLLRQIALVIPDEVAVIQLSAQSPAATGAVPVAVQTAQPGAAPVQTFTIVGATRDHESVALTLARLAVIPELAGVSLVSSTEDPRVNIVNFTIKASVRQEGAAA